MGTDFFEINEGAGYIFADTTRVCTTTNDFSSESSITIFHDLCIGFSIINDLNRVGTVSTIRDPITSNVCRVGRDSASGQR